MVNVEMHPEEWRARSLKRWVVGLGTIAAFSAAGYFGAQTVGDIPDEVVHAGKTVASRTVDGTIDKIKSKLPWQHSQATPQAPTTPPESPWEYALNVATWQEPFSEDFTLTFTQDSVRTGEGVVAGAALLGLWSKLSPCVHEKKAKRQYRRRKRQGGASPPPRPQYPEQNYDEDPYERSGPQQRPPQPRPRQQPMPYPPQNPGYRQSPPPATRPTTPPGPMRPY
jgi:hypothetical protein